MPECHECKATFDITDADLAMLEKLSPVIGGKTFSIPPPTHCPECRQQRRYACRNDRNYYPGKCMVCRKSLITSYSPDKGISVLCDKCFWSDRWDPLSYAQSYDFKRPFFEQFHDLRKVVPRLAIYHTQCENSDYTVHSSRCRNCYLGSSIVDCEDVHFSDLTFWSKNCLDLFSCNKMELCHECALCDECFGCSYSENCVGCSDSSYCFDCRGGNALIGCVGLRNQNRKILNRDASDQECTDTLTRIHTDASFRKSFEEDFLQLKLKHPRPATWTFNCEACTGNYLWNCKNAHMAFNLRKLEDVRYVYEGHSQTNTCDTTRIGGGEMLYECASIVDLTYSAFCNLTYQCSNLVYCDNCNGTKDSFGSFGLKKHQWCIFNKQYSQGEYEDLVPKIIEHMQKTGEWGEFFPVNISPFGYNETKAHEWYFMEQNDVLKNGWRWSEYEQSMTDVTKTIPGEKLPTNIQEIPDDILNWAIVCEVSRKPFRLIKQELKFYRDRGLPVPRRSPKQRHYDRIRPHNIRTLYDRTCGKCGNAIKTIYSPERLEIVYCESCYLAEIY